MARDINRIILLGNVGQDPEIKTFSNGGAVANFSLATTERWKQNGEAKERTEWHRVVVRGQPDKGLISVVERFVVKGTRLYLEGMKQTRTYEKDGETKYVTEVVLPPFGSTLALQDRAKGSDDNQGAAEPAGVTDLDDEIPF